ncbi:DUF4349 domain-containing protein [Frigoriglobus tundricola]|nr:DUF4349 domain-containing protein [Frigoriglobus tundricola]
MSEHVWVQEHAAAYLAGGLDAQEAERLEAHARDCPACSSALAAAQQLDGVLSELFTTARPDPELGDRAVARLRAVPQRKALRRAARWAAAVAAVLLLASVGAVAGSLAAANGLRMPGGTDAALFRKDEEELAEDKRKIASKSSPRERSLTEPATADGNARSIDGFSETSLAYDPTNPKKSISGDFSRRSGQGQGGANFDGTYTGNFSNYNRPFNGYYSSQPLNDLFIKELKIKPPAAAPGLSGPPAGAGSATGMTPADSAAGVPGIKQILNFSYGVKPGTPGHDPKDTVQKNPEPNPEPMRRIVLRSGDIEFEIESFDAASATVTKLVLGVKGAFIATVNSDKLTNGKVKGAITVRVPPEHLDGLVLDLRRELGKGGELKGVKLASQDVTKAYTDLESRLKAARTMEQRLLQIIKDGKGEIKQLLEAEKELGMWRTKIEELEGEIRYYANLAALSTLTITLTEREIKAAATITEREVVQAGVEVEDVDKAYQQLLAAIADLKGRIIKSELKQLAAGQFNAALAFELAAESSGPIRDRLRMLGRVARLEIDRTVQTEGGTLPSGAKAKRGETGFVVQLYNLANVTPRETVTLQVAAPDVPAAYQALRDAVAKTTGRVLVAQLNQSDRQNVGAQFDFEVRRTDEGTVRATLDAAGEELTRQVARAAETDSVTDTKVLYRVTLVSAGRLKPRETITLTVEVADVDGTATLFAAQVAEARGRQVDAKLDRDSSGRTTATLVFEVPLTAADGLVGRFKGAGTVRAAQSARDPQAPEGRYATARLLVTVTNAEAIVPDGDGLWPKVRRGLSVSAAVLLTSVTWVVFGLCVVLPWAVIGLGGYRLVRRFVAPAPTTPAPAAPPAPPPAPA